MVSNVLGDSLIRLKNSALLKHSEVELIKSKQVKAVLDVLKKYGFIKDYKEEDKTIIVKIAYKKNGYPKINNVKQITKPGRRIYVSSKEIFPVLEGRGLAIVSTPKGIMAGHEAHKQKLGGEFICKVW